MELKVNKFMNWSELEIAVWLIHLIITGGFWNGKIYNEPD